MDKAFLAVLILAGAFFAYALSISLAPVSPVLRAAPTVYAGTDGAVQDIYIKALSSGTYDRPQVSVKAGQKVRLHFSADPNAGCGKTLVMRDFNVRLVSLNGEERTAEFTPQRGTYEFSCSMRMFRGSLVVA